MSAACSKCCCKHCFGQHVFGVEQWMELGGVASRKMKGLVRVVFSPSPQLLLLRNKISDDDDGSCDETLQIPLLFSEELSAQMRLS